jgi:RsiW-degrading membrane proteinase PrsW (M82 family)
MMSRGNDLYVLRPSAPLPRVPTPDEILGSAILGGAAASGAGSPGEPVTRALVGGTGPRAGRSILWVALPLVMTFAGYVLLRAVGAAVGTGGLIIGSVFALLPVVPVLAVFLWLDRNEPEPTPNLVFAIAWGATVAAVIALVLNSAGVEFLRKYGKEDITIGAVFIAPWVEEAAKGAAVALIALRRRREFDGVVDGLVLAGLCGLGFAFVENVLYFGRAYTDAVAEHGTFGGLGAVGAVFVIRGLGSPFAHPMFTAAIGIGFGIAASTQRPRVRVAAPVIGYLCAVALHALWNLSAAGGLAGFLVVYALVMVPLFGAYLGLMVWARRREGRVVAQWLPEYGLAGWFGLDEVPRLASMRERRRALVAANRYGGRDGRRATRSFQHIATELAFLRNRAGRHSPGPDFADRERDLLAALAASRTHLPVPPAARYR